MQDGSTYADLTALGRGYAAVVSDTEYAARMYFHPEYVFKRERNHAAGSSWFSSYLDGGKRDFFPDVYAEALRRFFGGAG
jgi:hypothetical protein